MANFDIEIECNEDLDNGTLELELTECELDLIMDPERFFNAVFDNLNDGDYQVNGTRYEYLFIDTYNAVYDGTFISNAVQWNAIFALRDHGHAVLNAVDPEDIGDIRADWFN